MTAKLKGKMPDEVPEGVGRPSKFTKERCNAIVDAISHRIPYEFAAEANGISERTLYYWMELGYKHQSDGVDSEYTEFLQSIKKAEMVRMREHTDIIAKRPKNWQADAWLLERRWPKHFGSNVMLKEMNEKMNSMLGASYGEDKQEDGCEDDSAE